MAARKLWGLRLKESAGARPAKGPALPKVLL